MQRERTQRVKPLDELTPADLLREVPEEVDDFWQDARERQVRLVKALLKGALEEEMTVLFGGGRALAVRRVAVISGTTYTS